MYFYLYFDDTYIFMKCKTAAREIEPLLKYRRLLRKDMGDVAKLSALTPHCFLSVIMD
jgi:hypothetical protein